ncbi:prepilin-type N-terminal cleavage/methylation domain-containing protein [Marmoricola sp. OAE513]|uniref:type II secretion system protein n=1 Tax=Marmoricola sp. OAE513 TaxID=2817894 RepID=UPI001AE63370
MLAMRRRVKDERGESLVEVLVALGILGIAAVAILAGLQLAATASDINRKQTSGGAYVRAYAEKIESYLKTNGNYVPCAATDSYKPSTVGYTEPPGYSASVESVQLLTATGAVFASGSPCGDKGVQRLRIKVVSTGSGTGATEFLTIVVRKNCGKGTSCA